MRTQDRRPAFRTAVFAADVPDSVKVLLLRLLEDMNHKLIVSVPRSRLAADLDVPYARITERVKVARDKGYLDQVRRGRPGVTAVYQGVPRRGTDSVPLEVRPPVPSEGTDSVPSSGGLEVRPDHTQVGTASRSRKAPNREPAETGSNEEWLPPDLGAYLTDADDPGPDPWDLAPAHAMAHTNNHTKERR